MRRYLIIVAIALVILGVGVGTYFIFFSGSATVSVAPEGSTSLPVAGQGPQGSGTTPVVGIGATGSTNVPVSVSARLVQISSGPVVPGMVVVDKKIQSATSSSEVIVGYIERGSGNVFQYLTRAKTISRINNKTVPGIQSAAWLPNGSVAFVRYLSGTDFSTINTYALAATSTNGFFLPQNLSDVAVSASGIFSIASGVSGSVGSISRTDGSRTTTLFTSPLTALRGSFAGKNQYLVFSKPSGKLSGDAFLVDSTGRFSRIAGPLNGLVALASPSGKWVLVSYTQGNTMRMALVDTATRNSISLPVATIADKCVWTTDEASVYCGVPVSPSAASVYPDDWYQGAVQFSDRIWRINVSGRYAQLILDFKEATKGNLDATALAVDPSNLVLVFLNKNDSSLWSYSL